VKKVRLSLLFWLLGTWIIPSALLGGETGHPSEQSATPPSAFVLTVQDSLISLRAQDASLKAILEALGRELAIGVVAHISAHEKITVQFDQLTLTEALQRLHTNYAYVMEGQKVVKLIVLPPGQERVRAPESKRPAEASGKAAPQPAPFRFEFDPSKLGEEKR
jgi:type II secretory pathway component GspD/PulD (secretin)